MLISACRTRATWIGFPGRKPEITFDPYEAYDSESEWTAAEALHMFWLSVKRRIENWRKREDSALRAGIFKA